MMQTIYTAQLLPLVMTFITGFIFGCIGSMWHLKRKINNFVLPEFDFQTMFEEQHTCSTCGEKKLLYIFNDDGTKQCEECYKSHESE